MMDGVFVMIKRAYCHFIGNLKCLFDDQKHVIPDFTCIDILIQDTNVIKNVINLCNKKII